MRQLFSRVGESAFNRWALAIVTTAAVGFGVGSVYVACQPASVASEDIAESATSVSSHLTDTGVRRVRVVEASCSAGDAEATYPGSVRASQTVRLAFRVGGPLVEINVKPGDTVHQGDVLMRIDERDFQSSLQAAKAALDSARAKLLAMRHGAREEDILAFQAALDAAAARRDYLLTECQRHRQLVERKAAPKSQLESFESQLSAARAEVRAREQELRKGKAGARVEDLQAMEAEVRALEARLEMAGDQLSDSELKSPLNGIVTKRLIENHEHVRAGDAVLVIQDTSTIKIDVDLPEKEMLYRSLDKPFSAEIRFPAVEGQVFQAALEEIDTDADHSTRTYRVTFAMQTPQDVNLLPGMIADVSIPSTKSNADQASSLVLPATAVCSDREGTRFVWIVAENSTVRRRNVTVGSLLGPSGYEILAGISLGDRVVTAGAAFLHDGAKVEVMQDNSLAMR